MRNLTIPLIRALAVTIAASVIPVSLSAQSGAVLTGQAAFTDWNQQTPGVRPKITLADLPQPNPEEGRLDRPSPRHPEPANAWPVAPPGFKVSFTPAETQRAYAARRHGAKL